MQLVEILFHGKYNDLSTQWARASAAKSSNMWSGNIPAFSAEWFIHDCWIISERTLLIENIHCLVTHSAASSIMLSGRHTTQTQTSEVRWAVRFSVHWMFTMFAYITPKRPSHRQLKKTPNGRRSQLNQYLPYKLRSNLKPTWIFFVCVLQMIFLTKNLDVGTGAQQQRQEVY